MQNAKHDPEKENKKYIIELKIHPIRTTIA